MNSFGFNSAQSWQQQTGQFPAGSTALEAPEVASARNQVVNDLQRVSDAMRTAASSFESYARVFSRPSNPLAALGQSHARTAEIAAFLQANAHLLQQPSEATAATATASSPVIAPAAPSQTPNAHTARLTMSPAADETNGDPKKISKRQKRLAKQLKDPNAPKRPPSAYLLFQNEVRADMKERYPELAYKDLLNKVSEAWKGLSEDDKKVYQYKTDEEMRRWSDEKRDHEAGQTSGGSPSNKTAPATPATPGPVASRTPSVSVSASKDKDKKDKKRKEKEKETEREKDAGSPKKDKRSKH